MTSDFQSLPGNFGYYVTRLGSLFNLVFAGSYSVQVSVQVQVGVDVQLSAEHHRTECGDGCGRRKRQVAAFRYCFISVQ